MAENSPPPNASPSFRSRALPLANPMQSDRLYNRQVPFTPSLLADTPQSSSKRKRRTQPTPSLPQEHTPNPKPRKYAKQLTDPESPTRSAFSTTPIVISPNPVEDTATLKPKSRARRSVTPIPRYEPPSVVLTSPREVMAAPAFTSKRKSKSKAHARPGSIKIIPVKKELPDIDLSTPMPPPSPTDDPILLSGPFGPPASTPSRPQSRASLLTATESIQTDDIPCAVPDSEDLPYYDWRSNTRPDPDNFNSSDSTSLMDVHPSDADVPPVELPAFNLDDLPPSSDAWSDSDDDVLNELGIGSEAIEEGEGEYTGKWRTLLVKTKQDPPSSITRARMEQWGRPVSPFPEEAKSFQIIDEDEERARGGLALEQILDQDQQDEIDEEEVHRISVEPEGEDDVPQSILSNLQASGRNEVSNAPSDRERSPSSRPDLTNPTPLILHDTGWTTHRRLESDSRVRHESETENNDMVDEASDDNSSDQEAELSFVKITSADPHAAARAAAILKQHDYDCFTEIAKSKRRRSAPGRTSRRGTSVAETLARRGVSEGRITKDKAKKRASVGTGVIGSQVFISGTPVTTLRDLLIEVEAEVSFSCTSCQGLPTETPVRHKSSLGVFDLSMVSSLINQEGERQWAKDDWKLLDACFTDERFVVGRRLHVGGDGLADVEDVDLGHIVDRYIGILGGEKSVKRFGLDWERDTILQRAKALRKKQRSGIVAPPTTPLNSAIGDTPDVPDFTPLAGRSTDLVVDVEFTRPSTSLLAPPTEHISAIEPASPLSTPPPATPATFGQRVKGLLFSYLPSMSKTAPIPSKKLQPLNHPGLPLPPPDLLSKPRGPITTPARPPLPKAKHPKELVQLHPAPLPAPKTSLIPRLKPQRLVHLNPITPPEARAPIPIAKPRNSTGSVKDLVRSYEDLKNAHGSEKALLSKPVWRP
ncbi:hypothetical protein F5887DRAFT_975416 [Amanita rubescens]|nr:hypothetical protein F5887DRAFT_975416 [Amanita rubescens]